MRHQYRCQLRWADQDMLGHVNNVLYLDYLQDARVDMFRTHAPQMRADLGEAVGAPGVDAGGDTGLVVVRQDITYLVPLIFGFEPALVEIWVSEVRAASFTLAYEISSTGPGGERVLHVRASTVLTPFDFACQRPRRLSGEERSVLERFLEPGETPQPLPDVAVADMPGADYAVDVRFSDLDVYRHVNNVKYFEYFQESRIHLMRTLGKGLATPGIHLVVARTRVDYLEPVLHREAAYACPSWVSHLGRTSMRYLSQISDGDRVLARCEVVGVCIDVDGRPVELPVAHRERIEPLLAP